ncbi:DUF3221 domain-containing protein [Metaplanococcus flavidus]|uniref:DUF3221 domain-containing protein n=1 Tax=Metaplanococcus flavidus TaxID=569883 RepID=A0ABW3LDW6_9BACL
MRNPLIYFTILVLVALAGCSSESSDEPVDELGITGYIMDKGDEGILVVSTEAKDYSGTGGIEEYYDAVWTGGAPDDVEVGDYVEIQFEGGVLDSYPAQAAVGELEVIPGSTPEGATLSDTEVLNKALTTNIFGNEILTVQTIEFDAEQDEWTIVLKNTDSYEEHTIRVEDE